MKHNDSVIHELRLFLASGFRHYFEYRCRSMGYTPDPAQYIACDFLEGTKPEWVSREKVMMGARGFTKTFILQLYCEWRFLRRPDYTQIIYHSSTEPLAGIFSDALLKAFQTEPLLEHLRPDGVQSKFAFKINGNKLEKGYSVMSAGISTSLTGNRCTTYLFDDPESDVDPEASHDRIITAMMEAHDILHPEGHGFFNKPVPDPEKTALVVVGQPHSITTPYIPPAPGETLESQGGHPLSGAKFLRIPALSRSTGESLIPSRFTTEQLLYKKSRMTPMRWALQFDINLDAFDPAGAVIDVMSLKREDRMPGFKVMSVDPADSGNQCEWGFAVGGIIGNQVHIIDIDGFQAPVYEIDEQGLMGEEAWDRIFERAIELGVHQIVFEKNLKSAMVACRRMIARRKVPIEVLEYHQKINKLRRIVDVLHHCCSTGLVTFDTAVLANRLTLAQLTKLSYSRLPNPCDRLDALAGLLQYFMDDSGLESPDGPIMRNTYNRVGGLGSPATANAFSRLSECRALSVAR